MDLKENIHLFKIIQLNAQPNVVEMSLGSVPSQFINETNQTKDSVFSSKYPRLVVCTKTVVHVGVCVTIRCSPHQ